MAKHVLLYGQRSLWGLGFSLRETNGVRLFLSRLHWGKPAIFNGLVGTGGGLENPGSSRARWTRTTAYSAKKLQTRFPHWPELGKLGGSTLPELFEGPPQNRNPLPPSESGCPDFCPASPQNRKT